jgi:hypothetical protein
LGEEEEEAGPCWEFLAGMLLRLACGRNVEKKFREEGLAAATQLTPLASDAARWLEIKSLREREREREIYIYSI